MKLIADENIHREIVVFLRQQEHDVLWMVELAPSTSDIDILKLAQPEARIILTRDLDFGELIFHRKQFAAGVILLRLLPPSLAGLIADFRELWPRLESLAPGNFVVATQDKIRARPIESLA